MKKVIPLLLLTFLLSGCSVPGKTVKVYFLDTEGKLVAVERERPTQELPLVIAIDQLMAGPNDQESGKGMTTELPQGSRARSVAMEGKTAIVDMNSAIQGFTGNASDAKLLIAQVVYTATGITGIDQVILKLQGSDQFTLGSENYLIDHPLSRDDFKN